MPALLFRKRDHSSIIQPAERELGRRSAPARTSGAQLGARFAWNPAHTVHVLQPEHTQEQAKRPTRSAWRLLKRVARWSAYLAILAVLIIGFWMRGALYHHWGRFPREQSELKKLRALRQPIQPLAKWHEYRGILHSHSMYSHDCEVSFEEILGVLKQTGIDFICLSDHCTDGIADFNLQWRGLHDGKLFVPGFEMRDGFMPFGAAAGTVLSNTTDSASLARQVVDHGGVLFYAHPEEARDWERPELTGMEIYNIHSDFKRYRGGLLAILPEVIVNQGSFPEQVSRLIFQRPTAFLEHWDALNSSRHITGIAGNDCHQNTGLRIVCGASDELRAEDTGRKVLARIKLNRLTRPLARAVFGELQAGRQLFRVQLDPYERMARFVNTHVLAAELSEPAILDALRGGRVFVGFDMLADSSGFQWWADTKEGPIVMGEAGQLSNITLLHGRSPLPCRFTIVQNGRAVRQYEARSLDWAPTAPGKYRLEAELHVLDAWVPWVYSNPIELKAPTR